MSQDAFQKAKENYIRGLARTCKEMRILDVGCGNGFYTKAFCQEGSDVFGMDVKSYQDGVRSPFKFVLYDGKSFPFKDNFFDLVVSWDVLEHVEDDQNLVDEVRRVLRKGSQFYCGTPNRQRLSNTLRQKLGRPPKYPLNLGVDPTYGNLVHLREYTQKELALLLKFADFREFSCRPFWFGLRGKINFGIATPPFPHLAQYLIAYGRK